MNGIEHYEAAERLLSKSLHLRSDSDSTPADPGATHLVAAAHVHAVLAQTAAIALNVTRQYVGDSADITDWAQLIQPKAMQTDPCGLGCIDGGRDGCLPRCLDRMKTQLTTTNEECPF